MNDLDRIPADHVLEIKVYGDGSAYVSMSERQLPAWPDGLTIYSLDTDIEHLPTAVTNTIEAATRRAEAT